MPAVARLLRVVLLAGLAAGPALWLVVPGLVATDAIVGAPTAGVYPLLQSWWAVGAAVPPRFPDPGAPPLDDTLAVLLHPLVAAIGVVATVKLVMAVGTAATIGVTWRFCRRVGGDWSAAAATAAFTASPAVVAGITSGDLDAFQGWALLALPLAGGPACLAVGALMAVAAPTLLAAAAVPVLLATWSGVGRRRWFPLAGLGVGMAVRTALGWPSIASAPAVGAWFSPLTPAVEPERVFQVYVGFLAAGLVAAGLLLPRGTPAMRGWGAVGAAALIGALVQSPLPPERFVHLVPLAAALVAMDLVRTHAPAWRPAGAVWVATALVAEGWKGVGAPVPLLQAPLSAPVPADALAEGPVLDLPATRGAIRRALWFQTTHGHAIAADSSGMVAPAVAAAASALAAGGCPDLAAMGFRDVVVRREGVLRELGTVRACLGTPTWDDGSAALWVLPAPSPPASPPGPGPAGPDPAGPDPAGPDPAGSMPGG
jgi:hypothetical protein